MFWRSFKFANTYLGMAAHALLTLALIALVLLMWFRSLGGAAEPKTVTDSRAISILRSLKTEMQNGADEKMQAYFPEGACFIYTLYGLAWANLASESDYRTEGLDGMRLALAGQESAVALEPFRWDTQVRRGAFWLGQRNLLIGKYLALEPRVDALATTLTAEFHTNSKQYHDALMASPTRQIESYEGMCWPADMPAGLASLKLHDDQFGTTYSEAITAWETYNDANGWKGTALSPGRINQKTGQHVEPARGCANSLIVAIMASVDPGYAARFYKSYQEHFEISRCGFRMFREYPAEYTGTADVDSGPIIMGAGVTATGVGLAAARAVGDTATECDIRDLSEMFGFPQNHYTANGTMARSYLGNLLPMGDAFLAWGWSIPRPINPLDEFVVTSAARGVFHAIVAVVTALLLGQWLWSIKVSRRRLQHLRPS